MLFEIGNQRLVPDNHRLKDTQRVLSFSKKNMLGKPKCAEKTKTSPQMKFMTQYLEGADKVD